MTTVFSNGKAREQGTVTIKAEADRAQQIKQFQQDGYYRRATDQRTLLIRGDEVAVTVLANRDQSPKPRVITALNGFGPKDKDGTAYARAVLSFAGITMHDTQDGPDLEGVSPTNGVTLRVRGMVSVRVVDNVKAGQAAQMYIATRAEYDQWAADGLLPPDERIPVVIRPYTARNTANDLLRALDLVASGGAEPPKDKGIAVDATLLEGMQLARASETPKRILKALHAVGLTFLYAYLKDQQGQDAARAAVATQAGQLGLLGDGKTNAATVVATNRVLLAGVSDAVERDGADFVADPAAPGSDARKLVEMQRDAVADLVIGMHAAVAQSTGSIIGTFSAGCSAGGRAQLYM